MTTKQLREDISRRMKLRARLERGEVLTREEYAEAYRIDWAEIGRQLKEERITYGYSLSEVARLIGVSRSTLRRFEKGDPIRNARMIELAYERLFEIRKLEWSLRSAYAEIDRLQAADLFDDDDDFYDFDVDDLDMFDDDYFDDVIPFAARH